MSAPPRGVELDAIRAVEAESLPALVWGGVKVITTELLAQMYGTDVKNIQMNHTRNLARFEQGVHFFKVSGKALADLRPTLSGSQISAKTRSLMLWTERGAARHAKMIETDQAWGVFAALEDHYFQRREGRLADKGIEEPELSSVRDREPLLIAAVRAMVKHRLPFHKVYQTMNFYAGSPRFAVMTKAQVVEAEQFIDRLLLGNDTRADWVRIGSNKQELTGADDQPDLLGFEIPGTLAGSKKK